MRRLLCRDLSVRNDLLLLPSSSDIGCVLAGAALLTKDRRSADSHDFMLDGLIVQVQTMLRAARHWLLVGNDAWQPNTKIRKYNGLWRGFARDGLLPAGPRSEEFMIESTKGIKFFGFIECRDVVSRDMVRLLKTERACVLVATVGTDLGNVATELAQAGWSRSTYQPPLQILQAACQSIALVYTLLGDFDDLEVGAAIIGRPHHVDAVIAIGE